MRHPLLYEINTRCWLAELSEKAGGRVTLADIPGHEFDFWQRCGFTHLWLMGVWTLGARGPAWSRKFLAGREGVFSCADIVGSPYAITGYEVSRKLGGTAALAKFRRTLNERGIQLILDFIPNHTALDHPWVRARPDFYVTSERRRAGTVKPYRGATGWFAHGDCGHGSPWVDTLQLDYRNPELRRAMILELLAVAEKCDGVRCDMAMLELDEVFASTWREFPSLHARSEIQFWKEGINSVRARRPDFLLLAEAYWDLETRMQELGFDFTYDKRLYDRIMAHDARGGADYLKSLAPDFLMRSAHFLENHDEPRVASLLALAEHRAAALLILALPGMRFLHEGQLGGARAHANIHLSRRPLGDPAPDVSQFYAHLLGALPQTCIGRGEWKLLAPHQAWEGNTTHRKFVVIQWQHEPDIFDLAVVNMASHASQCYVPLKVPELAANDWQLRDLLSNKIHSRSGPELAERGLYLDLAPHGAQLFHCDSIRR